MAVEAHVNELRKGTESWNSWRSENPELRPDLSGIRIGSALPENSYAALDYESDVNPDLGFSSGTLNIYNINLSNTNLSNCLISKVKFENCNFIGSDLSGSILEHCIFNKTLFSEHAYIIRGLMANDKLTESKVKELKNNTCKFFGTVAYDTEFTICGMSYCDLTKFSFDESIVFNRVGVLGTKISGKQLASLKNLGGLTSSRLGEMTVVDDYLKLRNTFSGLQNTVHLISLFIFLVPYLSFLTIQWLRANFGENYSGHENSISIMESLARYIISGGETWREFDINLFSLVIFIFAFSINALRLALFIKTKILEHHRNITGFYHEFILSGIWKILYKLYQKLASIGILLVIVNTLLFLFLPIPI